MTWQEAVHRVLSALRHHGIRGPVMIVGETTHWFCGLDVQPVPHNDNAERA